MDTAVPKKVLVVDDEINNLRALRLDLEDCGYEVITAQDGEEGWQKLQQNSEAIHVILLDRMMPKMDGIAFMKQLKSDEALSHIPAIMQTAAAEKEQVIEGIEVGVYYYLIKPYNKDVMLSVVQAAIKDYLSYKGLREDLGLFERKLHLVKQSRFEVQTIEDARYLSTFLAQFFPEPERVVLGLSELLLNAIEHGNLGITYEEKTELNNNNQWLQEIERRLALPEYANKRVNVTFKRSDTNISVHIQDEGEGFDWQEYLEISPERAMDNHGRGIAMANMMSFDRVEYLGRGNEVVCTVHNQ